MSKVFTSKISKKEYPIAEKIIGKNVRPTLLKLIQQENPNFSKSDFISFSEVNLYREKYITEALKNEVGQLSDLEHKVINSLQEDSLITEKLDEDDNSQNTFGQRVADKVASFGGSWTFIISFGVFLVCWIILNIVFLANKGFDPYPFILLNLILSCLAAMQAPIIMMSQNRQEEKDRARSKKDYMINLKSELEIRTLHEKIDHLIMHQQQEMLEIQQVQIDMMNDILKQVEKK
jgi:uncharacterized membrane protein